jgi:hypothetical protein
MQPKFKKGDRIIRTVDTGFNRKRGLRAGETVTVRDCRNTTVYIYEYTGGFDPLNFDLATKVSNEDRIKAREAKHAAQV